jgi:hypothetical protein
MVMIRTCDVLPGARHARHARHAVPRPPHPAVHWPVHLAAGTWRRLIREIFLIAAFAVIY